MVNTSRQQFSHINYWLLRIIVVGFLLQFWVVPLHNVQGKDQTNTTRRIVLTTTSKNAITVFESPDAHSKIIQTIQLLDRFVWMGITSISGDVKWMQVEFRGVQGWIAPPNLTVNAINTDGVTNFANVGSKGTTGRDYVLYATTSLSSQVVWQGATNESFVIIEGPVKSELYMWWKVTLLPSEFTDPKPITGWIADDTHDYLYDTLMYFKADRRPDAFSATALRLRNHDICGALDNPTTKGWVDVVDYLPDLIPKDEKVYCLGSLNMRGDQTPYVVVFSYVNRNNVVFTAPTLRIFHKDNGQWTRDYQKSLDLVEAKIILGYTSLQVHYLSGDSRPLLVFWIGPIGTGRYIDILIVKVSQNGGIVALEPTSNEEGKVQVDEERINVLKVYGPSSRGTCCWTQMQIDTYAWQNDGFVKTDTTVMDEPIAFQNK